MVKNPTVFTFRLYDLLSTLYCRWHSVVVETVYCRKVPTVANSDLQMTMNSLGLYISVLNCLLSVTCSLQSVILRKRCGWLAGCYSSVITWLRQVVCKRKANLYFNVKQCHELYRLWLKLSGRTDSDTATFMRQCCLFALYVATLALFWICQNAHYRLSKSLCSDVEWQLFTHIKTTGSGLGVDWQGWEPST